MGTENRSQRNEYYSVCNEQGGLRNENQSLCNDQRFPYKNTAVSLQKHSAFTTKTHRGSPHCCLRTENCSFSMKNLFFMQK
jgi:hypothetical protein